MPSLSVVGPLLVSNLGLQRIFISFDRLAVMSEGSDKLWCFYLWFPSPSIPEYSELCLLKYWSQNSFNLKSEYQHQHGWIIDFYYPAFIAKIPTCLWFTLDEHICNLLYIDWNVAESYMCFQRSLSTKYKLNSSSFCLPSFAGSKCSRSSQAAFNMSLALSWVYYTEPLL